jgi:uncharacterized repeat protein (TIGR01451 family)
LIDIKLEAISGPQIPRVGDLVTFQITLHNGTDEDLSNIRIWDSLPPEVLFISTTFTDAPLIQNGNDIAWDISYKSGVPFVLHGKSTTYPDGQTETITFVIKIIAPSPNKGPIRMRAWADYSDLYYFPGGPFGDKHEPVPSDVCFYPLGKMVVFPNPFSPSTAVNHELKFQNIVPGSVIQIWTLSGEFVVLINTTTDSAVWNAKNKNGSPVSPGIYLFTCKNPLSAGLPLKGKIFLVK